MKISRRSFCACMFAATPVLVAFPALAQQGTGCEIFTPQRQAQTSPDEAIERLAAGNLRFIEGKTINCNLLEQVHETAAHQAPFAAILGCIDSRVPPELVFDQRIGDVFCARVAGNFVNEDILGSLEYAAQVAGAKAIVVLGHTSCGAIKSAIAGVEMGNITAMLHNIQPALDALTPEDGPRDPANAVQVSKVMEANARLTLQAIRNRSEILRGLEEAGNLKITAAIHDVHSGEVHWLS